MALWSPASCAGELARIDASTDAVVAAVPLDVVPTDVVLGAGSAWVGGFRCGRAQDGSFETSHAVLRIDLGLPGPVGELTLGPGEIRDLAVGDDGVWVARDRGSTSGELLRVDPVSLEVERRLPLDRLALDLWWSDGALWISAGADPPGVLRLDPATGSLGTVASGPWSFGVGAGNVWVPVPDPVGSTRVAVQPLDAATGAPLAPPVPLGDSIFWPFAADESGVWFVAGRGEAAVAHLDAASLEVDQWLPVPGNPVTDPGDVLAALDPGSGTIWMADPIDRSVLRVEPS